eukprot:CAMPEP_0113555226 /NCGR_PEP_ID=MMETSP0015_2-20120614/16593_1 /TAXON_ID=2838 /ORGANISM="Odontella" /LENGTH=188 /DNA_ID=CAMNT_0000456467 /DNA_START=145 /DNA_END=712 /DNA_ORIENTATION=- /assembly_acc=CAM_ASM_000160
MVFYECVMTTKNTAPFQTLTNLMKEVSHKIVEGGGIVRTIQNHGIRTLPHRFKAKYPDKLGNRYFEKGRFVSLYYDANPHVMREVETTLKMNEEVLRNTHLLARNRLLEVNLVREDRNRYLRRVMETERAEEEAAAAAEKAESGEDSGSKEHDGASITCFRYFPMEGHISLDADIPVYCIFGKIKPVA